jgi:hypothetical protein
MAFPWELNLDRPYHDEKWLFPEQRTRIELTDSDFDGSAEKNDELSADSEKREAPQKTSIRIATQTGDHGR